MGTWQRRFGLFLRVTGTVCALAIVAVFMPRAWMAACHEWLGLGPFPEGPIVEYLARSTSMFYAMLGGILWILSGDVVGRGRAIAVLGAGTMVGGAVLLVTDLRAAMPLWWTAAEGPFVVLLGATMLALRRKARAEATA